MPAANRIALPGLAALLVGAAFLHGAPLPARAQATNPAKVCADRWNAMKAANQTGDTTYSAFYRSCMAGAAQAASPPGTPTASSPTPTGPAATAARPSIKQCADLWNEMKAKRETGDLTYRDFAQQCLAGSAAPARPGAAPPPSAKPASPPAATPAPAPPPALQKQPDESDREAVNRCNGEWQAYKTRHNLSGAKAWHVFMARCLP
ncbi:hypothetical protein [Ancylobacter radicis]|uniref:Uncharacterized protein n=1 Tax=Ancylobacter radicis TaxID=2836179 RepID=A0ABS5R4I6_9HYPH|nr:hypothetical protein [Ancylobacter radicis]MBS9476586.1 hypothetical protein [Ancylobacter radicis]